MPNLPETLSGMTIVQISDLHFYEYTCKRYYQRVVDSVNELDADVIAMTGDVVHHGDRHIELAASFLKQVNARHGKFGVIGNHDYCDNAHSANIAEMLCSCGFTVLRNTHAAVKIKGAQLWMAGVDDLWHGAPDLYAALEGVPVGKEPTVLLSHNPLMFDPATHYPEVIDLTLSGHTHAGHVYLPFLWPIYRYVLSMKYRYGIFEKNGRQLHVTSGVGSAAFYFKFGERAFGLPRFRFNTNPEIAVLKLVRA